MTPHESKKQVREAVSRCLQEMPEHQVHVASQTLCERLLIATRDASGFILGFLPLPSEINLEPYLQEHLEHGVAIPLVDWTTREMTPVRLEGLGAHDLEDDRHGLRKPARTIPVPLESIEVVVVPGLAFTPECLRLGRGAFYDKSHSKIANRTAIF